MIILPAINDNPNSVTVSDYSNTCHWGARWLIKIPSHPEWVLVVGLVPFIHNGSVKNSWDEVITGSLNIINGYGRRIKRLGLSKDWALRINANDDAIRTLLLDLAANAWWRKTTNETMSDLECCRDLDSTIVNINVIILRWAMSVEKIVRA